MSELVLVSGLALGLALGLVPAQALALAQALAPGMARVPALEQAQEPVLGRSTAKLDVRWWYCTWQV